MYDDKFSFLSTVKIKNCFLFCASGYILQLRYRIFVKCRILSYCREENKNMESFVYEYAINTVPSNLIHA